MILKLLGYLVACYVLINVPAFLHTIDFYRRVRPIMDLSREAWLYYYNQIWLVVCLAFYGVSLIFFLTEELFCCDGSFFRFFVHLLVSIAIFAGGWIFVSQRYPFENNMALAVNGTYSLVALISLVLVFFWPLASKNYRGLYRR
jgi:hypothetical protein